MNPPFVLALALGGTIAGGALTRYAIRGLPADFRRPAITTATCVTAALITAMVIRFGENALVLPFTCIAAIGVAAATVDVLDHRLPVNLVLSGLLAIGAFLVVEAIATAHATDLIRAMLAGAATVLFHLVLALSSRGGLGAGDVKFAGVLGLALGRLGWPALFIGILLAWTLAAIAIAVLPRKAKGPRGVPMGPFLLAGFTAAALLSHAPA